MMNCNKYRWNSWADELVKPKVSVGRFQFLAESAPALRPGNNLSPGGLRRKIQVLPHKLIQIQAGPWSTRFVKWNSLIH